MTYTAADPLEARPTKTRVGLGEVLLLVTVMALIAGLAVGISIYLAAAVYAVFFVALCAVQPRLALFLTMTTAPFVQDLGIGPVKLAIAEVDLVLGLIPMALMAKQIRPFSPFWLAAFVYLCVCLVSTIGNGLEATDVVAFTQMVVYLFVATFFFSQLQHNPSNMRLALGGMVFTECALSLTLIVTRSNYILGFHKNAIGAQLCIGVLVSAALWWSAKTKKSRLFSLCSLLITSAGLLLSLSRGAWVGTALGGMVMLMLFGAWRYALRLALLAIPVLALAWLSLPAEQKEYATDISEGRNIQARYVNADQALRVFSDAPVLGAGVGYRKRSDATNLIIFTLAETGVVGLAAFLAMLATFAWMVCVVKVRMKPSDPMFALYVTGAGLMTAKVGHAMFDHYWQRGMFAIWAGAGMVIQAHQAVTMGRRKASVAIESHTATSVSPAWGRL